jgi:hypothetical protein
MADEPDKAPESNPDADTVKDLFADAEPSTEAEGSGAPPHLKLIESSGSGPSPPLPSQEFFIPIHQFVRLTPREVEIVDHPAFQRLGNIFQLGQTYLVYRGATHLRHEHAIGTLHVAQLIIDSLNRNAREDQRKEPDRLGPWQIDSPLSPAETDLIRLGALLHDIGHLPAGHTFEDELGLLSKHDSVERLDLVLDRVEWNGVHVEPLGVLIDRLYASEADVTGTDATGSELLRALVASDYADIRGSDALAATESFRLGVGRDLIGNTICADLLDYLHRDLHHLGKHKQFDTRLVSYMEVRREATSGNSKLVIYLRDSDRVRHDAVSGMLDLLESRYQLFEAALYHRTKLAAAATLERAVGEIAEASGDKWLAALPTALLDVSDFEMLAYLGDAAQQAAKKAKEDTKGRLLAAADSLVAVRQRRLQKKLYQRFMDQFTLPDRERIQKRYGHSVGTETGLQGTPAQNRLQALRQLEKDFSLPPLSLGMYCPPPKMSTKVAQVAILRDSEVRSLDDEEARDPRLTGGHLRAQQQRFENLWHVFFSCDPEVLADLQARNLRPLLIDAIDCFVLGLSSGPVSLQERAMTIASALAATPQSPWTGREVVQDVALARRSAGSTDGYPTGLRALGDLFVP